MSDAFRLPPRPNLEQYKKIAKDLQRACKAGDEKAVRDWAARWVGDDHAERVVHRWRKLNESKPGCALTGAQFFIARSYGFASWARFAKHLQQLARVDSPVSNFEAAADAIASGDIATLARLLREHPDLIHERSTREHRSTLLHYVSANGIEDYRQKTPENIVDVTRLLLDCGADVNAESDAYGGHATTFGLTATSWHPQHAGVQVPLMELLIERGARIDEDDVNDCLANGRGEAAEFLANHGAHLDFEGACGVGRIDLVKSLFPRATEKEVRDGFAWACEFGRADVVDFLLQHGFSIEAPLKHHGQTGLHWAALGGHAGLVKLLIGRGAHADAVEDTFGGTPLSWALYGWGADDHEGDYYEVVAQLVRAGARLDDGWFEGDDDRRRAVNKINADPKWSRHCEARCPEPRAPHPAFGHPFPAVAGRGLRLMFLARRMMPSSA